MSRYYVDGTGGSVPVPETGMTRSEFKSILENSVARETTALGQVEGLAAPGLVKAVSTAEGNKEFVTVEAEEALSLLDSEHALAASGAIDLTVGTTLLTAASGVKTFTLGNGTFNGQEHAILMSSYASTAEWTCSGMTNLFQFTSIVLNAAAHSVKLKWNETSGKWYFMGGNCLLS